ncbi:septation protein IspZ [Bdellovibrio sp. HCB337]|uniref:septation protein IspZ n=1 Tax=Bdellovibrio sp. HCB337 TaxID=3394358 RepID=UPI0039A4E559
MKLSIVKVFQFLYHNFGPLIGFYLVNHFFGFKAGVIASILVVIWEFAWLKFRRKTKPTTFFYITSLMVIAFGIFDLTLQAPFFFKLEAFITNMCMAFFFGVSLFRDKSLVQEIAETQGRIDTDQTPDKHFFFRFYTSVWTVYFVAKAIIYLWINLNSSFEDAFFLRVAIGKGSFWAMMFFSVVIPKLVWRCLEFLKVFPSQRAKALTQPE